MEIIEDRHARKATIIASQLPVSERFDVFLDETLADSIINRIAYTSHRFELKGDSLRRNGNFVIQTCTVSGWVSPEYVFIPSFSGLMAENGT